jgi:predicted phosphodiesterase
LADADSRGVDHIVCLGDIVGYGPEPDECVAMLEQRGAPCVRGNHDAVAAGLRPPVHFGQRASHAIRWTRRHISEPVRRMLASLPMTQVVDRRFLMVHAALHPHPNDVLRIRTVEDAQQTLQVLRRDHAELNLCFFGHTHISAVYRCDDQQVTQCDGEAVHVEGGATLLVNPGSVGWSRHTPGLACYATFDAAAGIIRFHRVPYEHAELERKLVNAGLHHQPTRAGHVCCWVRDRCYEALAAMSKLRRWRPE